MGSNQQSLLGFVNIDKPVHLTSHDCVAKIRRLTKIKRVGHAGTLDPAATGVLPIAVGKATRLLQFLPNTKAYTATIRFGWRTTSDDLEGEIIDQTPVPTLTLEMVKPHISQLIGNIQQIPPLYSAIQKGGKRLYELARKGEAVDVPPREVVVNHIEVLAWQGGEFPELTVNIRCQGGTYIRSIARDLGEAVQTGATLAGLRRTESSGFVLQDALDLSTLETQLKQGEFTPLPPDYPLSHLQRVVLSMQQAKRWSQGQLIVLPEKISQGNFVRVYKENDFLCGIGEVVPPQKLKPKIVLK